MTCTCGHDMEDHEPVRVTDGSSFDTFRRCAVPECSCCDEEIRPRYAGKHLFGPQAIVDRGAIRRAFSRAAVFCRYVPDLSTDLKRRLMKQALDQGESRLRNRLLVNKKAWVRAGMPRDFLPWEAVAGE